MHLSLSRVQAPDFGAILDSSLFLISHRQAICKSRQLHFQNISRRKPLLSTSHHQPGLSHHHLQPSCHRDLLAASLAPYRDSSPSSQRDLVRCKLDHITALLRTLMAPTSLREKSVSLQWPSEPRDLYPLHYLSDLTAPTLYLPL